MVPGPVEWEVKAAVCSAAGVKRVSNRDYVASFTIKDGFTVVDEDSKKKIVEKTFNSVDHIIKLEFKGNKVKVYDTRTADIVQLRFASAHHANDW